jgi:cytochrome P450 family 6
MFIDYRRGDMLDMFKDVIDEDSESGLDKSTVIGTAISMITAANTTSTSVLAYAFWELARHPDMQDRLREEIRNVLQISPEKASLSETFSLENLQKLDYLNMIIHETMRKHAPVPILTRGCTKDFLVEEADYKIKANEDIHIPCAAIMFDQRCLCTLLTIAECILSRL